jgi:hypothetical protein
MNERCDGYHRTDWDLSVARPEWLGNARHYRRCAQVAESQWAFRELYLLPLGCVSFKLTAAPTATSGLRRRRSVGLRRQSLGSLIRTPTTMGLEKQKAPLNTGASRSRGKRRPFPAIFRQDHGSPGRGTGTAECGASAEDGGHAPHSRCRWGRL